MRAWRTAVRGNQCHWVSHHAGGYPIFKEAAENALERKMTMELSMTIALVAALLIGEFFTTLVIIAFVLAAEILDQATITGESMPVGEGIGSPVYTGTINQSGVLEIRAEHLGRDTSFGKIIETAASG